MRPSITSAISATPKPYLARLYVQHDFAFGDEKQRRESDQNQLAGQRPVNRYSIYGGRFTIADFFDNHNYTHDPCTQFMAWGAMYNGAWDYPADTRGYTWGVVQELNTRHWAFRYGIVAEPKIATDRSLTGGCSAKTGRYGKWNRATPGESATARFGSSPMTTAIRAATTERR